ncbi:hypothetical protein [Burkholderia pseudomallei]|uniref:hypothetical protein n=1 Tax=Burkholderia pseudomallei TaxID=28450 RepID=UPI0002D2AD11|nr:hypothetical protein [Burkholderia pseudomallei]
MCNEVRHFKENGLLPCVWTKLHEEIVDVIRIKSTGVNAFNDLIQLGKVFEWQRHVVP